MCNLENATLCIVDQKNLAIPVSVVLALTVSRGNTRGNIAVRLEHGKATVCGEVAHKRIKKRRRRVGQLNGESIGRRTRCLSLNRRECTTGEREHDDSAQKPESFLHEFLRNKDADTSGLDALGELSSRTQVN
jgi:hypothetical protein